jgi:hypothetical protein
VRDVVTRRIPESAAVMVTGLVADAGGCSLQVPAGAIREMRGSRVRLGSLSLRRQPAQPEEVLLGSVIGQPVMSEGGVARRITDIALRGTAGGWMVWATDTRTAIERFLGRSRRLTVWDVLVERRPAQSPPLGAPGFEK